MAKKRSIEDRLAALRALEDDPFSVASVRELRKAAQCSNNVIVAKAADIAAEHVIRALVPELVKAFARFMDNPVKTDKGCRAKAAAAAALDRLDHDDAAVFLQGIRHVQREPAWGKPVDTADHLRARCAMALVNIDYPDAPFELATLLVDPEVQARRGAVQALAHAANETSEALLRMKVLTGDPDPDVLADCLSGLMAMNAERSMEFVEGYLGSQDPVLAEGAAIALADSRTPEAFEILRRHWEDGIAMEFKRMLTLPIALTRLDEAFDFLLAAIEDAYNELAASAVTALRLYRGDAKRRSRIRRAVETRSDAAVSKAYARAFELDE